MWRVIFVNPYDEILLNNDGKYTLGVTIPELKSIYIANNIQGNLLCKVLQHEFTHAYISDKGLKFPTYKEENIANYVAKCNCDM